MYYIVINNNYMRIAVDGNQNLAKSILEIKVKLESLGHTVYLPQGIRYFLDVSNITGQEKVIQNQTSTVVSAQDFFKDIQEADAFLIVNANNNDENGFIGASILMEIGLASILNQKIFLLYPVDNDPYRSNIEAVNPVILNGDLSGIV